MKQILTVALLLCVFTDQAGLAQGGPAGGFPQGPGVDAGAGRQQRAGGRLGGPPNARQPLAGTSVIRGRVLTADTGTPVRRAQVRAALASNRDSRLASTDEQGIFELRDLSAGRWEVTASKAGFVTMRFGQERAFEAGRPIEVADAQILEGVNFSLPRGAAINGRLFDEFGDPIARARVQALRYQLVQGTRRLTPTGMVAQSDDTGGFRLWGLMPGEYYVSALLRSLPVDDPDDGTSYAPTYYPGTGSVTEAQPVTLNLGGEASISFALTPVRTARVSGRVLSSSGYPFSGGRVMLVGADALGMPRATFGAGGRVGQDGTFTISDVAPGSYTLTAFSGNLRNADADAERGSASIVVAGEDLSGITVFTSRGAVLTGTVGGGWRSATQPQVTGLRVTAEPVPLEGGPGARPARVNADGTFTLTNLFGPNRIRVNGLSREWMVESIVVAGSDVTDGPFDFRPNELIEGAKIVLTDRITQVAGTVVNGDGAPVGDVTVVVFPEDETKWTPPSRYVKSARPDQQGLVKILGLPPGDHYLAVAVDYLEEGGAADPRFLALIKSRATRFSLGADASTTIDLRLVER
jgi:hypothetical protein